MNIYIHFIHFYKHICIAFFIASIALAMTFSLATFSVHDPSFFYAIASNQEPVVHNFCGILGSHIASFLLYLFGSAAWLATALMALSSVWFFRLLEKKDFIRYVIGLSFLFIGISMLSFQLHSDLYAGIAPGGLLGRYLVCCGLYGFDKEILYYITVAINFFGMLMIVRFWWARPLIEVMQKMIVQTRIPTIWNVVLQAFMYPYQKIKLLFLRLRAKSKYQQDDNQPDHLEHLIQNIIQAEAGTYNAAIFHDPFWHEFNSSSNNASLHIQQPMADQLSMAQSMSKEPSVVFDAPGAAIFRQVSKAELHDEQEALAHARAKHLETKLELFGIKGKVVSIVAGPVVTLFEYAPAHDVKVSKILALEDDLSLALEAHSLRIIAPIPGRSVVGFEVANMMRQTVYFADIAAGKIFKNHKGPLPLIIGRDTVGNDVVCDLTEMPHLLVAGSTGSGKSVALNSMLVSLLCKVHPDEVQLILIDPKRLEFSAFADVAHLIFPIVTDVVRVPFILHWAVTMMEERYTRLAEVGVRHITEYHKKCGISAMPYVVIVIDELADLMMTAGKDVEELIARLAQMARAAGIHLILATQRPSVDVITGLIKVNFPSRIACKVISKIDSRTILDCSGAEKLLGKGDMLFLNHKGATARVHGAYVKDEEIISVVDAIKKQRTVVYQELNIIQSADAGFNHAEDPLYPQVSEYVLSQDQVSISLLQRRFRIGYNRSARLIDTLEARGVLMPSDGGKFRKVLRT